MGRELLIIIVGGGRVDRHGRTLHIMGNGGNPIERTFARGLQQNSGSEPPPTKTRGRMETKLVVLPSKTYHFSGNPLLCRPSFWFWKISHLDTIHNL